MLMIEYFYMSYSIYLDINLLLEILEPWANDFNMFKNLKVKILFVFRFLHCFAMSLYL